MLHLIDNYYIDTSGGLSFTLVKKMITKKRDSDETGETMKPVAYLRSIEQCVERCLKERLSDKIRTEDIELKEALEFIHKEHSMMQELLQKALKEIGCGD